MGDATGGWKDYLDNYTPLISIKPENGMMGVRDNDYGYGLPFGTATMKLAQAQMVMGIDLNSIVGSIMIMCVLGIVGRIAE